MLYFKNTKHSIKKIFEKNVLKHWQMSKPHPLQFSNHMSTKRYRVLGKIRIFLSPLQASTTFLSPLIRIENNSCKVSVLLVSPNLKKSNLMKRWFLFKTCNHFLRISIEEANPSFMKMYDPYNFYSVPLRSNNLFRNGGFLLLPLFGCCQVIRT